MVTEMPKPDLLCLVQLLDGSIETFRVNVCNTATSCSSRGSCVAPICLCVSLMIVGPQLDTVTDFSYTIDLHLKRSDLGLRDIHCRRCHTYIVSYATHICFIIH